MEVFINKNVTSVVPNYILNWWFTSGQGRKGRSQVVFCTKNVVYRSPQTLIDSYVNPMTYCFKGN